MKKVFIDTNSILRFLLDDVHEQALEVKNLFQKAKTGKVKIIIPQIIIFEIYYALTKYYKFDKVDSINEIESLLSIDLLKIEDKEIFLKAIFLFKSQNLSFADCFLFAKSEINSEEVFTFDKDLRKINAAL